MKCVSQLYGKHPESDIYIIGTGASTRVFPLSFLENKITIGLNQAWKLFPVQYAVTIHPELNMPECMPGEAPQPEITWVTKQSKSRGLHKAGLLTQAQLEHIEQRCYSFEADREESDGPAPSVSEAARITRWLREPVPGRLYVWGTISTTAANLAANMGARNIIFIGCDNCALEGNHHAHGQHTRWLGASPEVRYREYYEAAAETRTVLRERGINVMSLTPFMGLESPAYDFGRLCDELQLPRFLDNEDISPNSHDSLLQKVTSKLKRKLAARAQ
jgi:hypothetical protein